MKKRLLLLPVLFICLVLSSCFLFGAVTTHPDMVEYTENEILEVAKDKLRHCRVDIYRHGDSG